VGIAFSDDCVHYDGRTAVPHPHLICTECREILDLDLAEFHDLRQTVARKTGYRVRDYRFDLFGVCPRCQERESDSPVAA
jgi:Fur family peroxide stress response transcriptional regulator